MVFEPSRRSFLAVAAALPAATTLPVAAAPAGKDQLRHRVLGKTGLKVTTVGFGCMITSDPSVITRGLEMGINYFDTARGYQNGNNERMVGAALKGHRDSIILSSKSHAKTAAEATAELETSLKELGTDHLDIWYIHAKDKPEQVPDELVGAWVKAKQAGKIRHIGLSTHAPNEMVDRILEIGKIEVVLATYNFTMGGTRDATFERIHKAGLGLVAMKVMAGGQKGRDAKQPQMQRPMAGLAALKWAIRKPYFATAIPSMTDLEQLDMNFQAMTGTMGPDDERILSARLEQIRTDYCRMCYGCEGQCTKGLPVTDMLRYVTYADGYGQFALGREHFLELPEAIRSVKCGDCASCSVQCRNGVDVARRLRRAQELFA
jgi:aryl-alcohol dehydrogenase-like predicted oxidoreductase